MSAAEQTQAQIPALQTSVAQTLNALAVLTGQAPGTLNTTLGDAAPIPPAPADLAVALAFPADTLRQRPDVRAAELKCDRRGRAWRWPMRRATRASA